MKTKGYYRKIREKEANEKRNIALVFCLVFFFMPLLLVGVATYDEISNGVFSREKWVRAIIALGFEIIMFFSLVGSFKGKGRIFIFIATVFILVFFAVFVGGACSAFCLGQ